jgi:hypothetical protein
MDDPLSEACARTQAAQAAVHRQANIPIFNLLKAARLQGISSAD